ncbi:hypothetical protein TWF281_006363 [Arthrobotrys megalospora]
MALPRRLQGCTHLFSFLSVLASSRNRIRPHSVRPVFSFRDRIGSSRASSSMFNSKKPYKKLQLQPKDRAYIEQQYDPSKPKRLRTEADFLQALRAHGYVPAVDRVDEMLDMNRSPFQSKEEFDKLTLGLLLRSARSANGDIRNPYKIPGFSAGQNPVRTKNGEFPTLRPPHFYFLFPDDTNWSILNKVFPLQEPPRPWHPVSMIGLKQDYTREEVARRLEWSQVQNAKRLRNGYGWPAPDPATYKYLDRLPPPPPPVMRDCNTCKKPRYLLRFWNFYFQRWQHVSSPHRPGDCTAHRKGGGGRLMYAPKGTKIGGLNPSAVENKEWIEEETAVKLLFRSALIQLPTVNPVLGQILGEASINNGKIWKWTDIDDVHRWALRGGRQNGLVNLTKVTRMTQVETARKEQQLQFLEDHKELLNEIREILKEDPITPEDLEKIPLGQFYPQGHPAVGAWRSYEFAKVKEQRYRIRRDARADAELQKKIKAKLREVDQVLEEMKVTKAEILMLERGQGETWGDREFSSLRTRDRAEKIQSGFNLDRMIIEAETPGRQARDPDAPAPYSRWDAPSYSRWDRFDHSYQADEVGETGYPRGMRTIPSKWSSRAAGGSESESLDAPGLATQPPQSDDDTPGLSAQPPQSDDDTPGLSAQPPPSEPLNTPDLVTQPPRSEQDTPDLATKSSDAPVTPGRGFSTHPGVHNVYRDRSRWVNYTPEPNPPPFRKTAESDYHLYDERFRKNIRLYELQLDPRVEGDREKIDYIRDKLEGPERRAIQREEDAYRLRQAYLWQNSGTHASGADAADGTSPKVTESAASESKAESMQSPEKN